MLYVGLQNKSKSERTTLPPCCHEQGREKNWHCSVTRVVEEKRGRTGGERRVACSEGRVRLCMRLVWQRRRKPVVGQRGPSSPALPLAKYMPRARASDREGRGPSLIPMARLWCCAQAQHNNCCAQAEHNSCCTMGGCLCTYGTCAVGHSFSCM